MPYTRPELPECLKTSLGLRMPTFYREPHPQAASPLERVRQMEEYMELTAYTEGELTECRVEWLARKVPVQKEWEDIPREQWEVHRRTKTETAVGQAKRMVRPDLYNEMQDCDWMVRRLSEEIERMDRDATRASRIYTMVTGG